MPDRSETPVILALTISSLTTVAIALAVSQSFGFDLLKLHALVIIPLGAVIFGLASSMGAIPGMRLANYPAGPKLRMLMTGTALTALFLYLIIQGALLSWSHPAHPGLLESMHARETAGGYVMRRGSKVLFEIDHVGAWGYAFFALKFVGAAGGAWTHHAILALMPYCQSCGVFTRRKNKAELHFKSPSPGRKRWIWHRKRRQRGLLIFSRYLAARCGRLQATTS